MSALDRLAGRVDLTDKESFAAHSVEVLEALVEDNLAERLPGPRGGYKLTPGGKELLITLRLGGSRA